MQKKEEFCRPRWNRAAFIMENMYWIRDPTTFWFEFKLVFPQPHTSDAIYNMVAEFEAKQMWMVQKVYHVLVRIGECFIGTDHVTVVSKPIFIIYLS